MRRLAAVLSVFLVLAAGDARAGFDEGLAAYERGDYATALRELRPLAEQDAAAQFLLGLMYDEGRGVSQDYAEAAKWYRFAAEQGDADGQNLLGAAYANGKGVPQDYVQSHMWLNLSAAQGLETARNERDIIAERMTPAQIAEAQRLAREWTEKHEK